MGATGSGSPTHRYGRFGLNGNSINAHRAAWILFHGQDPGSAYVCHKCDYTLCVNPSHLFLGSNADNLRDMANKGRAFNGKADQTHCKRSHEFTPENTYLRNGRRHCRACRALAPKMPREAMAAYMRERRRKQREQRVKLLG